MQHTSPSIRSHCATPGRSWRLIAAGLMCSVVLAGCAKDRVTTGSVPKLDNRSLASMNQTQLRQAADRWGKVYDRNPKDKRAGLGYAETLRLTGRNEQALAVMRQMVIHHPNDEDVLAAYGKAQAEAGQLQQALETIRRAQRPDRPDWKLLSAEGAILDQLGKPREARALYRKALDIEPNNPGILSNLGMSYLLEGDLHTAESFMRKAIRQPGADSRVRQNLALVVGLQGRFDEAEKIALAELSPEQAAQNIAYLRSTLRQQNSWAKLKSEDRKKKK